MTVILGDGIAGLESLEPGSVSLVLSDLPSGETEAAFDVKPDFDRLWPAVWRALKPNGNVVFMASSMRFAFELVTSQPKAFRYDLGVVEDDSDWILQLESSSVAIA